jgi:hypothetical protein
MTTRRRAGRLLDDGQPNAKHPSTGRNTEKTHRFATGQPGVKVGILRENWRKSARANERSAAT